MSFFGKLFFFGSGKNKPEQKTSSQPPKKQSFQESEVVEGKEPSQIVNRVNEIKYMAWHAPEPNTLMLNNIKVSGVSFNNPDGVSRQKILSHMRKWEVVDIVREQSNQHDENTIAVISGMGMIGYLDKHSAKTVSSMIEKGTTVLAKLSELYGGKDRKHYGAAVDLHLHLPESIPYFEATVVGKTGTNENEVDRADIARELSNGEIVFLSSEDFDDKERVFVECAMDGNFGRLSAKDAKKIYPLIASHKHIAVISENSEGGPCVSVCFW